MQDQKNRSAARSVSAVWFFYGVYLLVLGWLAFGSHTPDVERELAAFGLRQLREDRYVVKSTWFGQDFGESLRVERSYVPNYGGVLAYALGGGLIAYYFSRQERLASREEREDTLPHGGAQEQG